jgi:hypothetical protein
MLRGLVLGVSLSVLFACISTHRWDSTSPGVPDEETAATAERWIAVTFRRAVVQSQRPDGTPWHKSKPDNVSVIVGGILGVAAGNPALGMAIGTAMATPGGDPLAPAAYVVLTIGGNSYRISATTQSYSPHWVQPIAVDARALRSADRVVIQVMDGLDDGLIGQQEYKVDDVLKEGARTLTNLGAVASIDLEVAQLAPRRRQEYDLVVPGNAALSDLLGGASPDWRAIPVWNGDTVTIDADGSVCPSSWDRDKCYGPEGVADQWLAYNLDDFKGVPHAALVAYVPGARLYIAASRQLIAEQSGPLVLLVNDRDERNNRGSFRARVVVDPPQ